MADPARPPWPIWTPSAPGEERPSILQLLASHVGLLDRHRGRMRALARIALERGIALNEQAYIIADVGGRFGSECLVAGAGVEFLVADGASAAMVIAMDRTGVRRMLAEVIREGAEHIQVPKGLEGQVPLIVVDDQDEPGLGFVAAAELLRE